MRGLKLGFFLVILILVLAAGAAVLKILLEDLPAQAAPQAVEERFAAPVLFLRGVASTYPAGECDLAGREEPPAPMDMLGDWAGQVARGAGLFDDPAIVGAYLICWLEEETTVRLAFKEWVEPDVLVSRSMILPPDEWPRSTLWYARGRKVIRYQDQVKKRKGKTVGFELVLDLARLQERPER